MASPESSSPAAGDRLDSWKEIAAHFQRDVRTVKRWERTEGLPVHRHVHSKRASIYAYRSELDAWWMSRARPSERHRAVVPRHRPRTYRIAGAVALVLIVSLGAAFWPTPAVPPLAFDERDWVLITDFENRTGEDFLDGTLEATLTRELSESRFVNIAPPERNYDVLRLMQRPLDTPITREVGLEVSQRDGGIRAVLTGRVERFDRTFVLSVSLVDPQSGTIVATIGHEADDESALWAAVQRLRRSPTTR